MLAAEREATIGLSSVLSPVKALGLIRSHGSAQKAVESLPATLQKEAELMSSKKVIFPYVVYGDRYYPDLLAQIPDPPLVVYYKGNLGLLGRLQKSLAVVGTRKMSPYGQRVTEQFAREAAENKVVTVSGLAFGIDTVVHSETLRWRGETVAVLGTGLAKSYPVQNQKLFDRIGSSGSLLLSEYPECPTYHKWMFPRRNRIIAGLSPALLVIEAPLKSGAMITADLAAGYYRAVFAVPGSIFAKGSAGTNRLLCSLRAAPALSLWDIYPDIVR